MKWIHKVLTLSGAQPPRSFRMLHRAGFAPPLMALLSILSGCNLSSTPTNAQTIAPDVQPTAQTIPIATPTSDPNWETLASGLERRTINPALFVSFNITRIDPAFYTFRVHYSPGAPLSLTEWRTALPNAVAFFNANFFDRSGNAQGLAVSDGVVYGRSYTDRGGMLQVQDGVVRVRSTLDEPYLGEPLEQAAQAFPMLITNGAAAFTNRRGDSASRRTIVGQDAQGRIVVLSSSSLLGMTLVDLSALLPTMDLGLVTAVNLDGGGSTLLAIYPPDRSEILIPSFDPVPVVIAVYAR